MLEIETHLNRLALRSGLHNVTSSHTHSGPPNPDNLPEDGKLKSEVMVKDNRRYYLDLKENNRGRFLRVSGNFVASA